MQPNFRHERPINAPDAVLLAIVLLVGVHVLLQYIASSDIVTFIYGAGALWPVRFSADAGGYEWPGGALTAITSLVTYALLHGDWLHVGTNCIWFLIFGSPVAWRFGTARFLVFCAVVATSGAAMHLLVNWGDRAPMIGASAVVEGLMGAALRFMLSPGGFLSGGRHDPESASRVRAMSLNEVLSQPLALALIAFVLFTNAMFSAFDSGIAWGAHIGGLAAGLLLFPWFDPIRPGQGGPLRRVA